MTTTFPIFWGAGYFFWENEPGFYNFTQSSGTLRPLRQIWADMVETSMLPPEQQWEKYYNFAKQQFLSWGYSEKEVRWWFLRTGQGPQCFKQFPGVGPGSLPPYEVWRDWHFFYGVNSGNAAFFQQAATVDARYAYGMVVNTSIGTSPPGYIEPMLPNYDAATQSAIEAATASGTNLYDTGNPLIAAWWNWFNVQIVQRAVSYGSIGTAWSDELCAGGNFVHVVPPAFLVLNPYSDPVSCSGPIGLPIGVMFMLDKLTGKQWARYFNERLTAHAGDDFGVWPKALAETLSAYGIGDQRLWDLQAKLLQANESRYKICHQKSSVVFWGGQIGMILSMIVISVIAAGVVSAIALAVEAASFEAAAALTLPTEPVTGYITAGEVEALAKTAQTVYSLGKQVMLDDPNLFSIAGSLVSLGNTAGVGDAFAVAAEATTFDAGTFANLDFQMGEMIVPLDIADAGAITNAAFSDFVAGMNADPVFAGPTGWDEAGFIAAFDGTLDSSIAGIVDNIDLYAGDPAALLAEIERVAIESTDQIIADAAASVDDGVVVMVEEIIADGVAIADVEDFGPLTLDQLDEQMFFDGIDAGTYEAQETALLEQVESAASAAASQLSTAEIQALLKIGATIEGFLQSSAPIAAPAPAPAPAVTAAPAPGTVLTIAPTTPPAPSAISPVTIAPGVAPAPAPGEAPIAGLSPLWLLITIATSMTGKG